MLKLVGEEKFQAMPWNRMVAPSKEFLNTKFVMSTLIFLYGSPPLEYISFKFSSEKFVVTSCNHTSRSV